MKEQEYDCLVKELMSRPWPFDKMTDDQILELYRRGWSIQQLQIAVFVDKARFATQVPENQPCYEAWNRGFFLAPPDWRPAYDSRREVLIRPDRAIALTTGGHLLEKEKQRLDRARTILSAYADEPEIFH